MVLPNATTRTLLSCVFTLVSFVDRTHLFQAISGRCEGCFGPKRGCSNLSMESVWTLKMGLRNDCYWHNCQFGQMILTVLRFWMRVIELCVHVSLLIMRLQFLLIFRRSFLVKWYLRGRHFNWESWRSWTRWQARYFELPCFFWTIQRRFGSFWGCTSKAMQK